jgi:hypothetical protein
MAHWLIFAGLGPLIGLAVTLVLLGLEREEVLSVYPFLLMTVLGMPFTYVVGLLPALLGAFAVRLLQNRRVSHEWLWVSLGAPLAGVIFMIASTVMVGRDPFSTPSTTYMGFALIFFVSGSACWCLSKRFDKNFR